MSSLDELKKNEGQGVEVSVVMWERFDEGKHLRAEWRAEDDKTLRVNLYHREGPDAMERVRMDSTRSLSDSVVPLVAHAAAYVFGEKSYSFDYIREVRSWQFVLPNATFPREDARRFLLILDANAKAFQVV